MPYNQKLRLYLIYNRSYGRFSGKIPNFSSLLQQGSSEQSLTDIIKLADSENPLVGASIWVVYNFLLKIANFRCHSNNGMSEPNVTGIGLVEMADHENRAIEPKIATLSYIRPKLWQISGKIPNFSLPWQQGSSEQSLTDTIKLAYPEKPIVDASILSVCHAQAEL